MHRDGDSYHPNVMQEIMQDLLLILQTLLIRLESLIQCTIDVLSALYEWVHRQLPNGLIAELT